MSRNEIVRMNAAAVKETLARIWIEQRSAGETLPAPATPAATAEAQLYALAHLASPLAPGYISLLLMTNGVDFNGTVLYAVASPRGTILDFERQNAAFRASEDHGYILYGETGDELFAHQVSTQVWHILDRGSLSCLESFADFDLLLHRVLTRAYQS